MKLLNSLSDCFVTLCIQMTKAHLYTSFNVKCICFSWNLTIHRLLENHKMLKMLCWNLLTSWHLSIFSWQQTGGLHHHSYRHEIRPRFTPLLFCFTQECFPFSLGLKNMRHWTSSCRNICVTLRVISLGWIPLSGPLSCFKNSGLTNNLHSEIKDLYI